MRNNFQFFSQRLIRLWQTIFNFQKKNPSPITYLPRCKAGHPSLSSGFTLLELLVVISIIAILITIGITSFSTAQKKGRDAKRKSDIREVQQALESYYSVCGYNYPIPTNFFSQGIICSSPSIAIMPTIPTDPRVVTPYACDAPAASNCTSSAYTICAYLESEATSKYCLHNQQ